MDRIIGQPRDIVGVGVATRDPEDPLRQEFPEGVHHLARVTSVVETGRQAIDQTEPAVRRLEDDGPAIRTGMLLVELGHQGLPEKIREQNRLCAKVRHARPPSVEESCLEHSSSTTRRSSRSLPFANYPG